MSNRISSSSIRMYSECSKRYEYHYRHRLRPKLTNGAFMFGLAIDRALNHLLENMTDLEGAINTFNKAWAAQTINNKLEVLSHCVDLVYSKKDFDGDLLLPEDRIKFKEKIAQYYEMSDQDSVESIVSELKDKKAEKGWDSFSHEQKTFYNYAHWLCLKRKGHIMLKSYYSKVLPKIEKVHAIQKNFNIQNAEGDSIIGVADLVVRFKDGTNYILDNKTSSMLYSQDSGMRSQQLILYYHALKEEYNLDGVGFIVLYKQIRKNKTKICKVCNKDGSGQRHKTCDAAIEGKRCNGEWEETIDPECDIDIILNKVNEAAENLVIETFDRANDGIKKEVFAPNLFACGDTDSDYRCAYFRLCWNNDKKDLIELDKRKEE